MLLHEADHLWPFRKTGAVGAVEVKLEVAGGTLTKTCAAPWASHQIKFNLNLVYHDVEKYFQLSQHLTQQQSTHQIFRTNQQLRTGISRAQVPTILAHLSTSVATIIHSQFTLRSHLSLSQISPMDFQSDIPSLPDETTWFKHCHNNRQWHSKSIVKTTQTIRTRTMNSTRTQQKTTTRQEKQQHINGPNGLGAKDVLPQDLHQDVFGLKGQAVSLAPCPSGGWAHQWLTGGPGRPHHFWPQGKQT